MATEAADWEKLTPEHDDLSRIATANCSADWNQTFSFDAFSNIVKNATVGTSFQATYALTSNHISSLPGCTPSYDANGFLTYDCAHNYTWGAAGKPTAVDTIAMTYDALGRMVEQSRSGTYSEFVYDPTGPKLATMTGATFAEARVALPGGGQAIYYAAGLTNYWHPDWLGSSRLETTTSRAVAADIAFAPYGETYVYSGQV